MPGIPRIANNIAVATCAIALLAIALQSAAPQPTRQLVLVIAKDWTTTTANLYRLERSSLKSPWRSAGPAIPVVLGRTGLAWDEQSGHTEGGLPPKKEGDGKSPAGIFRIGTVYGTVPPGSPAVKKLRLTYQQVAGDLECVDDTQSAMYNRMVRRSGIPSPDWNSSEKISSLTDSVYRWLAVIDYNDHGTRRGAGSCIFLHVADPGGKPTSGCTAMKENDLLALFRWIDPRKGPVIVQTAAEGLDGLKQSQPALLRNLPPLP